MSLKRLGRALKSPFSSNHRPSPSARSPSRSVVSGFEQALEDVAVLVEGELNDAWSNRRLVWVVRVGKAVYNDALDRCDTYRLGHKQKHVGVCDVYKLRLCGKLSQLVVL